VLGKGAAYIVDGSSTTYSNIGEEDSDRTLSTFGITVHMLSQGDEFDFATRTPRSNPAETLDGAEDGKRERAASEQ
jgi:cyanophycinase